MVQSWFFNRLKSEIRNNAFKNEAQILVDELVNDDYSGSNDFNVPFSVPGPGQNSMWSQPPFMANQIYPDQSMNPYGNQINQNPGWPGPGPYQNQVLPNQPGHNQTGNSNGMGPAALYATDPDKRKMIQNQLIILIHAAKCQKRADNQDGQVSSYFNFHRSKL